MGKVNQRLWKILAGVVILLGVVLVTGCGVTLTQGDWTKPGMTDQQWRKDSYECERDARSVAGTGGRETFGVAQRLAEKCLAARGYTRR